MNQFRWSSLFTAGLIALALGSAAADDNDHLLARRALEEGRVLPLAEVLAAVKAKMPGKVLEVELEVEDGVLVYDLKLLTPSGGLKELEVDAATGKILKIEDDD
ncbi:MAG TPA: PepSY domain-containing protein [Methyloceanibacter sp.]|jgi:uncharacterized membrane protein YkoI|nr:PepSY domain-containing protein [Methyloceanibacter sp.]